MSLLRAVLTVVSPLVLAAATLSAGCAPPYKSVACTTDTDCPTQEQIGHLTYDGGAAPPPITHCCSNLCVIVSSGCDSGYRLVASHSGAGYDVSVCAPTSLMCEAQLADMTTPPPAVDM